MAKLDCLPEGVARALKGNATFVGEEGPMRQAVLAACPPTKAELLETNPGALDAVSKVRRDFFFVTSFTFLFSCFVLLRGGGGGGQSGTL